MKHAKIHHADDKGPDPFDLLIFTVRPKSMLKKGQAVQVVVVEVNLDLPMDHFHGGTFNLFHRPDTRWTQKCRFTKCFVKVLSLEPECNSLKQTLACLQSSHFRSQCLAAYFYASNGKCSPTSTKDLLALKKFSVVKEKFMDSDDMDFCLSPLPEISAPLTSTLQGFCAEDLKMKKKKKLPHTLEEDESCPEKPIPIPSCTCLWKAIMHKVEEFKCGAEDESYLSLKNFVAANPTKPMCITTESYCLSKAPITGVLELCDIFKVRFSRHLHQSQNLTNANVREKLPHSAGDPYASMDPRTCGAWADVHSLGLGCTPNKSSQQLNPSSRPPAYGGGIPTSSHEVPSWQTPRGYWTPSVYAHPTPTATNGTAPTSYSSGHEPTMCCHDPELG
ncbi:hypothetical protein F5141DRAFT_1242720 [Pisolithus sp. B1]|nr:hypothetical protein F5141DRAFT_1242720 [Pisolithus sp. B1]